MSWIPFRKQPKRPTPEVVADNEFDAEIEKFNKIETNTRKIYKDMKRYVEDNASLVKSEQRFCQELAAASTTVEQDQNLNKAIDGVQQTFIKQTDFQNDLNLNIRKGVIDPMKKFCVNFASVNSAMKRREQSLQDYAKYLNRREKLDSQSGKYDANERYLGLAKADFQRRNTKLLEELPKFYECRLTYFEPCLETLIKSQHGFYKNSCEVFEELCVNLDCPVEQWTEEQYREETKKRLNEIKSLSIVAEK